MAQDAHIGFSCTVELRVALELQAEAAKMPFATYVKSLLAQAVGQEAPKGRGATKKFADRDARKAAAKQRRAIKRNAVKGAIEMLKERIRQNDVAKQAPRPSAQEEAAQAEMVKRGQEAARNPK